MSEGTLPFASGTDKEHAKELQHETPFPTHLARTLSKRSEKELDERSLHRVPCKPMFPGTSLSSCRTQKGYPHELRHETPYPERLFRTLDLCLQRDVLSGKVKRRGNRQFRKLMGFSHGSLCHISWHLNTVKQAFWVP